MELFLLPGAVLGETQSVMGWVYLLWLIHFYGCSLLLFDYV